MVDYSYDALGNLRSKAFSNWNGSGARTVTNSYNSKNQISSSNDNGTVRTIAYDTRGNVTTLGNLAFVYDASDQPTVVTGGANGNYVYDGNLKRVKSVIGGKTIYNVYDSTGRLVHVDEVTDGKETDYLHGMGQTLARIENGVFTYLHPDHLGSPQAGTKGQGNPVAQYGDVAWNEHYTPFGEALINDAANDNQGGFTGHIKDKATGLNYMQARYYDPKIGRFLSVDPVTFMHTRKPVHFNRFTYANNDPVNKIDPFGLMAEDSPKPPKRQKPSKPDLKGAEHKAKGTTNPANKEKHENAQAKKAKQQGSTANKKDFSKAKPVRGTTKKERSAAKKALLKKKLAEKLAGKVVPILDIPFIYTGPGSGFHPSDINKFTGKQNDPNAPPPEI